MEEYTEDKGGAGRQARPDIYENFREIMVAVKESGGGDPANNSRLAAAITKAKAANMPNDNIKRVIDRALGSGDSSISKALLTRATAPAESPLSLRR